MENEAIDRNEQIAMGIRRCCKALRLSPALADRALGYEGDAGNLEFLYQMLDKEVQLRKARRLGRLPAKAGFPASFDPGQFDSSEVDFPPGESYSSLMKLPFCTGDSKKNVVMLGGPGTGKTMLSIILGQAACTSEKEVRFFRTDDLVAHLTEKGVASFAGILGKTQVIILDEFGYNAYGLEGARLLLSLISRIDGRISVILNTNLEFARWPEVLVDKTVAASLAGRILQGSFLLLFGGHDRRFDGYRTRVSS